MSENNELKDGATVTFAGFTWTIDGFEPGMVFNNYIDGTQRVTIHLDVVRKPSEKE